MSLFDLFKKTTVPSNDLIWQTQQAKLNGCLKLVNEKQFDLCIAWFEETRDKFEKFLNFENQKNIKVVMAKTLFPYSLDYKSALFLEHYPLFSKEQNLLANKKTSGIWFLSSFDDPLLKIFAQNVLELMQRMGINEDEYIEHKMISKSIVSAQKKLEEKIIGDYSAQSGEEWFQKFQSREKKSF